MFKCYFTIFRSTIVGLASVKRDKYSVFNFLNFANPSEPSAWDRTSQEQTTSTPNKSQTEAEANGNITEKGENLVEKELNKGKNMKSIFSHLMKTEKETQKNSKPVSFQVKTVESNKKKEFKSIFSHLEDAQPIKKTDKPDNIDATSIEAGGNIQIKKEKKVNIEMLH